MYRIICRNKDKTEDYIEPITDVMPVSNDQYYVVPNPVKYTDSNCKSWTCDRSDIIEDPVIDRTFIAGKCYHVLFGG